KALLFIAVQPKKLSSLRRLEKRLNMVIEEITMHPIEDWELQRIIKMIRIEQAALLQDSQELASFIGNMYVATGDKDYIHTYMDQFIGVNKQEVTKAAHKYLKKVVQHTGYLLPMKRAEKEYSLMVQKEYDTLDTILLQKFKRTLPVEPGCLV